MPVKFGDPIWGTQKKSWYEQSLYERQTEVSGLERDLWRLPEIPKEEKERPLLDMLTFLGGALNIAPSVMSGAVAQLVDEKPGFSIQEYFQWVFGENWRFKNQGSWGDVIQLLAESNPEETFWDRKAAQVLVGLALDILTDPLTYMGAGVIKGALTPAQAHKVGRLGYKIFTKEAAGKGRVWVEEGAQAVAKNIEKIALGQSFGFRMPWSKYVSMPFGKGLAEPIEKMALKGGVRQLKTGIPKWTRALYGEALHPKRLRGFAQKTDEFLLRMSRYGDKPGVYDWFKKAFMPGTQAYKDIMRSHEKMRTAIIASTDDIASFLTDLQKLPLSDQKSIHKYMEGLKGKAYKNGALENALREKAYFMTKLIKEISAEDVVSEGFFEMLVTNNKGIESILTNEVKDIVTKFFHKEKFGIYKEIPVHDLMKATDEVWSDMTVRMLQGVLSDSGFKYDKSLLDLASYNVKDVAYKLTDVPELRKQFAKYSPEVKEHLNAMVEQSRFLLNKWFDDELAAGIPLNYITDYMTGVKQAFKGVNPALEIGGMVSPYQLHRDYKDIDDVLNNIAGRMVKDGYIYRPDKPSKHLIEKFGSEKAAWEHINQKAREKAKGMLKKGDATYGQVLDTVTESVYARGVAHYKAMARKQLLTEVKPFGQLWDEAKDVPMGFSRVKSAKGVGIPELDGYVFTNEVSTYLTRLIDTIVDDESIAKVLVSIDKATNWWKVLATSVNPGFHFRNMYSNHFLGWIWQGASYFNPRHHALSTYVSWKMFYGKQAKDAAIRRLMGTGNLADDVLNQVFAHKKTLREVVAFARERGLLRKEFRMLETVREEGLKRMTKGFKKRLMKFSPFSRRSYAADMGEKLGSLVENQARFAAFLNEFKRTGSLAESLAKTNEVFVNYLRLTPFEQKIMRKIVPFWSWMKQNTANQFKFIFTQPGRYAVVPKVANAIAGGVDKTVPDEMQPTYFKDLWMWQLPLTLPNGTPLFFNPNLPFQDLNRLSFDPTQPGKSLVDFGRKSLSAVSPFLKIPLEIIPGYDLFRQQPLERYPGYKAPVPGILQMTALLWHDKFPDMAEKIGLRYENGTMTMNPKIARIIENLLPFINNYARALAATPNKENYENRFQQISYLVGIKVKPLPMLRQRKYYLLGEIKARKEYWKEHEGYWYGI